MKRALVLCFVVGASLTATRGAAQIQIGMETAFVADNHLVIDWDGLYHLVYFDQVGGRSDILYTTSEDEGFSWSTPVNLTSTPDLFSFDPPDIAVDSENRLALIWSEGPNYDSSMVYLQYEGLGWIWPQVIANTGNWATGPKVEFDSEDTPHVVWYDQGDPHSRLAYLKLEGDGPWPVVYIGPDSGYAQYPSLAIDDDGNPHVAFSHGETWPDSLMDVFYVGSADGGDSWPEPARVCSTYHRASLYPHILLDAWDGTPHVVWQEGGRGVGAEIHYASNSGKGWTVPENLSNTGATSLFPTLSQDAGGILHLVWSDEVDGDFDVYSRAGEWADGAWTWAERKNLSNTSQSSRGITQVEYLSSYGSIVCWLEGDTAPFTLKCRSGFSDVRFEDGAESAGFTSTARARGAAWTDIDGDDLEDLVVLAWNGESLVHHNRGDKTFEVLQDLGTSGTVNGAAWGDFDNDGDRDLAVTQVVGATRLYRNVDGDSLVEEGAVLGIGGTSGWGLAWADYDRDGYLDLYVTSNAGANALYHNGGPGKAYSFSDSAAVVGVDASGILCNGVSWADYDLDGWPDIYVAAFGPNLLFHNEGDGSFTEVAVAAGVDNGNEQGMACSWADFDTDGDLDLFVLNNLGANALYRNEGDGTFTDVTASVFLEGEGKGSVALWEDVDSDGDPDLFASLASTALFRNNGGGLFTEVASVAGLRVSTAAEFLGAGWADADSDGDADLFLTNGLNGAPDYFFFSGGYLDDYPGPVHHWLTVDLVGAASNRDAIGAQATLRNQGRAWVQEVSGGLGLSQNGGGLRFGLGDDSVADTLIVRWPSGTADSLYMIRSNQRKTIREGSTVLTVWPGDTDNDGNVDEEDVLPLVVHWHQEGGVREVANPSTWQGQTIHMWDPDSATYADADGSGRVEAADLLPIGVNWGKTHALPPGTRICRPVIEDHGRYLGLYEVLYEAVAGSLPGTPEETLERYLESLIALARGSESALEDRLSGFTPNPCRTGTRVHFDIARPGRVTLDIYDVAGRKVARLVNRDLPAGSHAVFWDGLNSAGRKAAPGIYLCRLKNASAVRVRKVVVVR